MIKVTTFYYFIFGVLTILGGVIGYVNKKSVASLVAGGISGALLLLAGYLVPLRFQPGLMIGLVVSVMLAGRFIPHYLETRRVMPDALMSLLSAASVMFTILAWYAPHVH